MKFLVNSLKSLSKFEIILWVGSVAAITVSFLAVRNTDYLTLCASVAGATSLIFIAKGNVLGQFVMLLFAALYGAVSFYFRYYGEMITYLGMNAPVTIIAIISWLKNPAEGGKPEVKVNTLKLKEYFFMLALAAAVTVAFYFILSAFDTPNIIFSTVSVFTSFIACYLEIRRSEFYAICFVANDIVLIILWTLATVENINYICMIICFTVFLINDIYGFINWTKRKKRQHATSAPPTSESEISSPEKTETDLPPDTKNIEE